jgi:hypothetical protein
MTTGKAPVLTVTHPKNYFQAQLVRDTRGIVVAKLMQNKTALGTIPGKNEPVLPATGMMRLEVQGNLIRLYVEDRLVGAANSTVPLAGQVGLITTGSVSISDLSVETLSAGTTFGDGFSGTQPSSNWLKRQGALSVQDEQLVGGSVNSIGLWIGAGSSLSNTTVAADVTLGAGQTASLIARYTENLTYYEARLTANASGQVTASLVRVMNNKATTLRSSLPFAFPALGRLTFTVSGSTLMLAVDGMTDGLSASDSAVAGPGLSGVILGTGARLDDFSVTAP